uniref:hypothetical protein n=1 Tax=Pseudomonas putida TaxID=303 RepID=UPI00155DA0C3|nr:hypothetical protein [Pseudomonas putida]
MNLIQKAIKAAKDKVLLKYHRVAARMYLKRATYVADQVIYTRFKVPTQALRVLREKANVRIPRHPATQSALIWPGIPGPSGHLFHGHPAGQSERSDAGVALLVRVGWRRQFLRPFAH